MSFVGVLLVLASFFGLANWSLEDQRQDRQVAEQFVKDLTSAEKAD